MTIHNHSTPALDFEQLADDATTDHERAVVVALRWAVPHCIAAAKAHNRAEERELSTRGTVGHQKAVTEEERADERWIASYQLVERLCVDLMVIPALDASDVLRRLDLADSIMRSAGLMTIDDRASVFPTVDNPSQGAMRSALRTLADREEWTAATHAWSEAQGWREAIDATPGAEGGDEADDVEAAIWGAVVYQTAAPDVAAVVYKIEMVLDALLEVPGASVHSPAAVAKLASDTAVNGTGPLVAIYRDLQRLAGVSSPVIPHGAA